MNIAVINTFDAFGGAANAARRLNKGLNLLPGHSAAMVVKEKRAQDDNAVQVTVSPRGGQQRYLDVIDRINRVHVLQNRTPLTNTLFTLGYPGYDISPTEIIARADILNIHWVSRFQSVESLASLLRLGKPVVWTLHDQWPFTGGCHYSAGCDKYKTRCTQCPQLLKDDHDTANKILTNKLSLAVPAKLFIVTPSRWLSKCAQESFLFRNLSVQTIPNSVETDIFRPLGDKTAVKNKYDIPGDVVTILFGALSGNIERKGFHKLMAAFDTCLKDQTFKSAVQNKKIRLLCFGTPSNELDRLNIPYSSFGKITHDLQLRDIYNASDLFVLPSLEDNLPNTMLEAMACGTPVIAFDIGGMPDMISDRENGRLISAFDTVKFGRAVIDSVLNKEQRKRWGVHARQLIETRYKLEDQARDYSRLFSRLLPGEPAPGGPFPPPEPQYCTLDVSFNPLLQPLYQHHAGEDL